MSEKKVWHCCLWNQRFDSTLAEYSILQSHQECHTRHLDAKVPEHVIDSIEDAYNGNFATEEDLREALTDG